MWCLMDLWITDSAPKFYIQGKVFHGDVHEHKIAMSQTCLWDTSLFLHQLLHDDFKGNSDDEHAGSQTTALLPAFHWLYQSFWSLQNSCKLSLTRLSECHRFTRPRIKTYREKRSCDSVGPLRPTFVLRLNALITPLVHIEGQFAIYQV